VTLHGAIASITTTEVLQVMTGFAGRGAEPVDPKGILADGIGHPTGPGSPSAGFQFRWVYWDGHAKRTSRASPIVGV